MLFDIFWILTVIWFIFMTWLSQQNGEHTRETSLGLTLHYGQKPIGVLLFSVFWAWADERTKPWIEGRHFSWLDVSLNLLGTAIGILVITGWGIMIQ